MSYSTDDWRKAILSVMMEDQTRGWDEDDLFEAAYQWLVCHIPTKD